MHTVLQIVGFHKPRRETKVHKILQWDYITAAGPIVCLCVCPWPFSWGFFWVLEGGWRKGLLDQGVAPTQPDVGGGEDAQGWDVVHEGEQLDALAHIPGGGQSPAHGGDLAAGHGAHSLVSRKVWNWEVFVYMKDLPWCLSSCKT